MEKEIPSVPKRDCSVFPAGALRLALLPGFSYHKGFLSFPAAGGRSLRAESHIFGGVRFVHVQFRKADFSALLEEFDAQPVGGDGVNVRMHLMNPLPGSWSMRSTSGSLAYMAFCASLTPAVEAPREPQWMGIHLPPL